MLTEPNSLRLSVEESDHSMLPVPYMVIDLLPQDGRSVVVCIEIHIECINGSTAVVVDDNTAALSMLESPFAHSRKLDRNSELQPLESGETSIPRKHGR